MLSQRTVAAGQRYPEARKAPRYPISAPAHAIEPLTGRKITGWVSVISRSGCYFRTADTEKAESILRLCIEWRGFVFETWARTVHAIPADGMGLAFIDTEPAQLEILARWIADLAEQSQQ